MLIAFAMIWVPFVAAWWQTTVPQRETGTSFVDARARRQLHTTDVWSGEPTTVSMIVVDETSSRELHEFAVAYYDRMIRRRWGGE